MTKTDTADYPFSLQGFRSAFDAVRPLVLAEWPDLDPAKLDEAGGDPDAIVALVTASTQHSKARVRKHLGEIAEVAGVDATSLEGRVLRLIHALEGKLEPMQETARAAVEQLESRSRHVVKDVKKAGADVEDTLRGNLWRSLFGALGIGVLIGLVLGLTRGR